MPTDEKKTALPGIPDSLLGGFVGAVVGQLFNALSPKAKVKIVAGLCDILLPGSVQRKPNPLVLEAEKYAAEAIAYGVALRDGLPILGLKPFPDHFTEEQKQMVNDILISYGET